MMLKRISKISVFVGGGLMAETTAQALLVEPSAENRTRKELLKQAPYTLKFENGELGWQTNGGAYLDHDTRTGHHNHDQGATSEALSDDFARSGKKSIKCILRGANGILKETKNRNEWNFGSFERDKEFWYGFSYRFAEDYPAPVNSVMHMGQCKSGGTSGDVFFDILEAERHDDPLRLKFNVNYGSITRQEKRTSFTFQRGRWHDIVVHAKIGSSSPGFYRVWIDDEKVFEYVGLTGIEERKEQGDIRLGQYSNVHEAGDKIVYLDNIRFGSSYDEVDPSKVEPGENTTAVLAGELRSFSKSDGRAPRTPIYDLRGSLISRATLSDGPKAVQRFQIVQTEKQNR